MPSVRAFIAVELPEEVRPYLTQLQDRLRQELPRGVRWQYTQGVHLTLKFLGNVETHRLSQVEGCVAEAARGSSPFGLTLGGLGCFPNLRQPRVIWVGVRGELEQLAQLHAATEASLQLVGFSPEGRAFTPHLALGRLREETSREERRSVGDVVASLEVGPGPAFHVTSISLMRSQLTPHGAIYTRLAMGPLLGRQEQLKVMPKG